MADVPFELEDSSGEFEKEDSSGSVITERESPVSKPSLSIAKNPVQMGIKNTTIRLYGHTAITPPLRMISI